ncbi:MAG: hypothetical protein LBK12_04645 [Odoribacteraceae bacterium]|jgi:hypothetical protein|nr:hypothetical protein [Odoribacteraceae bacterium]
MKHFIKNLAWALVALACNENSSYSDSPSFGDGGGEGGTGGSMARFTISGDYLYTVDNSTLKVFDLSIPGDPLHMRTKDQALSAGAETIFTLDTLLLIGSQNGMYIYDVSRPEFPEYLSQTLHIKSCDPVVASGHHAYVTLNSTSTWCGQTSNLLQVYDIADPRRPQLLTERPLTNPRGLGLSGDKLFVCDNGVKVFDVTDPSAPVWVDDLDHIRELEGIDTYDVIPVGNLLLVIGSDGLYQFSHAGARLTFVSKLTVKRD